MESLGERIEGRYEAFLGRRCAGVRLRCELEARILRDRAACVRLSRREEAVPIVAVGLDRLLQRLLQDRHRVGRLLRRSLKVAQLAEDALAVVRNACNPLPAGRKPPALASVAAAPADARTTLNVPTVILGFPCSPGCA